MPRCRQSWCSLQTSERKSTATLSLSRLLLSIAALPVIYLSKRDIVHDGLHIFLFLGGLAANMKAMPLTRRDQKYLSPLNILDGFSEAIIIYDKKGRVVYVHDGLKAIRLSDRLEDIYTRLMEAGALNDSGLGRPITIGDGKPVHLQYSSILQAKDKVFGRIITLRDVSEMVERNVLSGKNRQLELL